MVYKCTIGGRIQQVVRSYWRPNTLIGALLEAWLPLANGKQKDDLWNLHNSNSSITCVITSLLETQWQKMIASGYVTLYQSWDSRRWRKTQFCNLATNFPFISAFPLFLPYSIFPPVPSSAVCYNRQIRAQTASWQGEMWHKAQEPYVSTNCNDYNRWLILLLPLM